jgi:hypothetical protein
MNDGIVETVTALIGQDSHPVIVGIGHPTDRQRTVDTGHETEVETTADEEVANAEPNRHVGSVERKTADRRCTQKTNNNAQESVGSVKGTSKEDMEATEPSFLTSKATRRMMMTI